MYKFVRNFKQKDPNKVAEDVSSSSFLTLNTTSNNNNTNSNNNNEQFTNSNKIANIEPSSITTTTYILPNKKKHVIETSSADQLTSDAHTLTLNSSPSVRTPFTKIKNNQANKSKLKLFRNHFF